MLNFFLLFKFPVVIIFTNLLPFLVFYFILKNRSKLIGNPEAAKLPDMAPAALARLKVCLLPSCFLPIFDLPFFWLGQEIILQHTPDTLDGSLRAEITKLVSEYVLCDSCRFVPDPFFPSRPWARYLAEQGFAARLMLLECCPVFSSTRPDRAGKAAANRLLVIFDASADTVGLLPADIRQMRDTFAHDPIDFRELRWFMEELHLGEGPCVQAEAP